MEVDYFGYDVNPNYINYAKKKYKEKGKFFCKTYSYWSYDLEVC